MGLKSSSFMAVQRTKLTQIEPCNYTPVESRPSAAGHARSRISRAVGVGANNVAAHDGSKQK